MVKLDTHRRLIEYAHWLIVETNMWKVEEGEMTEEELLDEAVMRTDYMKSLPFSVFSKRLLSEIPDHYFGNT